MDYPAVPNKFRYPSITSATNFIDQTQPGLIDRLTKAKLLPKKMIFVYDKVVLKLIIKMYGGKPINLFYGDSFTLTKLKNTAITGNFGIGGPVVGVLMELFIGLGIEKFYSIGYAGSISKESKIGDIVLCNGAIPDDGVTQHYLGNIGWVHAKKEMINFMLDKASHYNLEITIGKVWSTSAPFRETREEIEFMQKNDIIAVDMESATLLSIGEVYDKEITIILVISDNLNSYKWELDMTNAEFKLDQIKNVIRIFED